VKAQSACTLSASAAAVLLSGCFSQPVAPVSTVPIPPAAAPAPPVVKAVPDVVPHVEPRSRYGNPPFYDVFGHRYYVLSSSADYVERGVASWYGPGFHKIRTSTGELYDMYGMTAAHKTLPLPAYVRVTNLQNGLSIVVRVNDRGPFVGNRIIDLSYTAAAKLDMLRNGTAMVEVRSIDPTVPAGEAVITAALPTTPQPAAMPPAAAPAAASAAPPVAALVITPIAAPAPAAAPASGLTPAAAPASAVGAPTAAPPTAAPPVALFVQAGAFADPANAERLAATLRGGSYGNVFVRDDWIAGRRMYRVRIGPVRDVPEFDRIVGALARAGVPDAHLALD
jgi:rare lipoprotein A